MSGHLRVLLLIPSYAKTGMAPLVLADRHPTMDYHALQADLRLVDACHELVDAAWRQWGATDIWVNNAGADTLTGEAGRWAFEKKLQELPQQ